VLIGTIGYPLAVHSAVILKHPAVGFGVLLVIVLTHTLVGAWNKDRSRQSAVWGTLAGISLVAGLAAVAVRWNPTFALFLPPVLINLSLLALFGRTLLPGREPLISRLSRLERGELPPELIVYTRRLTWIWTVSFAALALESVLLAAYTTLEVWSLFTNILNYAFIATLFVAEHVYRIIRFGKDEYVSPLRLVRNIARRGIGSLVRS